MDCKELIESPKYYATIDLRYNNKYNFKMSLESLNALKKDKELSIQNAEGLFNALPLKTFNSKFMFFANSIELKSLESEFLSINSTIFEDHFDDYNYSRIFSETEGSLEIENVPTTTTRIEQISRGADLSNKNDRIIKNMLDGIEYVKTRPTFNKENLKKLYSILSYDCLEVHQVLHEKYYRDKKVYIDKYEGCPVEQIESCMDSLFEFVNDSLNNKKYTLELAQICHYYIVYIHPYFDYNGRTARMVELWITLLSQDKELPLFLSEAINDAKHDYYLALKETRDMNNDVTYFLIYMYRIAIQYALTYKNVDYIENEMLKRGKILTSTDKVYIKKILIKSEKSYFDYRKFLSFSNVDISKQAAFKALNKLEEYGIISSMLNDQKMKLFKINEDFIQYE